MKLDICIKGDFFNNQEDEIVRSGIETRQIPSEGDILCLEPSEGGGMFYKYLVMEVYRTFYQEGEAGIVYVIPM